MLPPIPNLSDYDISPVNGFIPSELPLLSLPDPYYAKWETTLTNLHALLMNRRIRETVDLLPILSTDHLHTENEWRRAYVVLIFLLHGYIWGGYTPADKIPPPITIPLLQVCKHLELPPVATFAGVCLWNHRPIFPDKAADDLDNLACINTYTGSLDEQWFYLVSVATEARGASCIPKMLRAITAAREGDSATVIKCLQSLAETVDAVTDIMERMYEQCDPHVFYHRVRPYLAGSRNMADAGLPNGVIYDDGSGKAEYQQFGGGSNAQSSLFQFFDIVLGVEHYPTGGMPEDVGDADAENGAAGKRRHGFIHEMRSYMPGPHRKFLEHVETVANIREFVNAHRNDKALTIAYDACLAMLRNLRDKHIRMVSRYIIIQSREAQRTVQPGARRNLATVQANQSDRKVRGTGGTSLIPFLKQARDETGEPAIDAWARRLLTNTPGSKSTQAGVAPLGKVREYADGKMEVVGLSGTWATDDSSGAICHW